MAEYLQLHLLIVKIFSPFHSEGSIMRIFLAVLISIMMAMPLYAQSNNRTFYEREYQNAWCETNNGSQEVVLQDKARADCVTSTHAIEFDFANKWAESIGQALYYGISLNKNPGIVLIMEDEDRDLRYLKRVQAVAEKHNITLWTITPSYVSNFIKEQSKAAK